MEAPIGDGLGLHDCLGVGIGGPARHRRPWRRRLRWWRHAGYRVEPLGVVTRQRLGEPGGFVDPAFEGKLPAESPVCDWLPGNFSLDFRLRVAIEENAHRCPIVRNHHVMPASQSGLGRSFENAFANLQDELTARRSVTLAADPQPKRLTQLEQIARVFTNLAVEPIPKPKRQAARPRNLHRNRSACELQRPIDCLAGKRRMIRPRQVVGDRAFDLAIALMPGEVLEHAAAKFLTTPKRQRFFRENSLCVGPDRSGWLLARIACERLQRTQQRFHNLRLRLHFQSRRSGRPGGVATEVVLMRWRNIASGSVSQLDVERRRKRTLRFQLEAGDGVDLVRYRGNRQVADTQRLQHQLLVRIFVNVACLLGINLDAALRATPFHLLKNRVRPGETFGIGQATGQGQRSLIHGQRRVFLVVDFFKRLFRNRHQPVCIFG